MDIGGALQEIAELIDGAGVPATIDARDLNPPGAWVVPAAIGLDYLDPGTWSLGVQVFLIAPDNGTPESLAELGEMLGKVAHILRVGDVTPQGVILPNHGADPLPAFLITLETKVNES